MDESILSAMEEAEDAIPQLFVDRDGKPMKFSLPPKSCESYFRILKKNGGLIDNSMSAHSEAIHLAGPGFKVPNDATTDYYSFEFIRKCIKERKVVDKVPFLIPKGEELRQNDGESNENGSKQDLATNRGRNKFTEEEDMKIMDFVYAGNFAIIGKEYEKIKNKIWEQAGREGAFGNHSGESARCRYQKIIISEIETYIDAYKKYLNKKLAVIGEEPQGDVGEMTCSQLGPSVNTQTTKHPLFTSTPCVMPVEKADKRGAVVADVVRDVPLEENSDSDTAPNHETRRITRRKSQAIFSESTALLGNKKMRKNEAEKPRRASSFAEGFSQEIHPSAAALAEFVVTANDLDNEYTQTKISMQTMPPRRLTRLNTASHKADANNAESADERELDLNKANDETTQQVDATVAESMPYKLISALSKRYGISPKFILRLLGLLEGSFVKVISCIERKGVPLPETPNSSGKEN